MTPFTRLDALAAPLPRSNVDTDQIIRIDRLIEHPRGELGPFCLEVLHGPDFSPDAPRYRSAQILVAGDNFGCGSSREHAVWALIDRGYRAVLAPSFGDIFYANSFQNGLLPVRLPAAEVAAIVQELGQVDPPRVIIDLEACRLTTPAGRVLAFEIEPERRQALLAGLDDIGQTLLEREAIDAYRRRDALARPWIYPTPE